MIGAGAVLKNGTVVPERGMALGVPATIGSQIKGPVSRLDLMKQHAGLDMQAMYPAGQAPKADAWDMAAYAKAAEACNFLAAECAFRSVAAGSASRRC